MTTRSNPFDELEHMFERLSRQFEEASQSWGSGEGFEAWTSGFESMAIDLAERDEAYVARIDLPGFDRDEVEITVSDHTLHVDAEHEESAEEEGEHFLRRERKHRSQERSIRLPGEVDKDAVDATMEHGVLEITLPKVETEKAKKIEIS